MRRISGEPDVKVAAANVPLDYDLWGDLRESAGVGLHPAGLQTSGNSMPGGTANHLMNRAGDDFRGSRSFQFARDRFQRALIVSVMLAFCGDASEGA